MRSIITNMKTINHYGRTIAPPEEVARLFGLKNYHVILRYVRCNKLNSLKARYDGHTRKYIVLDRKFEEMKDNIESYISTPPSNTISLKELCKREKIPTTTANSFIIHNRVDFLKIRERTKRRIVKVNYFYDNEKLRNVLEQYHSRKERQKYIIVKEGQDSWKYLNNAMGGFCSRSLVREMNGKV